MLLLVNIPLLEESCVDGKEKISGELPKKNYSICTKTTSLRTVVLNLGATAPYGALLTFRGAEILRGAL